MDDMQNYLAKKAAELNLERGDQLAEIQTYLDSLYPGQCRAASLQDGVLRVTTPNASVATEVRMRQREILGRIEALGVAKMRISIG